jgi:hypothetical protein
VLERTALDFLDGDTLLRGFVYIYFYVIMKLVMAACRLSISSIHAIQFFLPTISSYSLSISLNRTLRRAAASESRDLTGQARWVGL